MRHTSKRFAADMTHIALAPIAEVDAIVIRDDGRLCGRTRSRPELPRGGAKSHVEPRPGIGLGGTTLRATIGRCWT